MSEVLCLLSVVLLSVLVSHVMLYAAEVVRHGRRVTIHCTEQSPKRMRRDYVAHSDCVLSVKPVYGHSTAVRLSAVVGCWVAYAPLADLLDPWFLGAALFLDDNRTVLIPGWLLTDIGKGATAEQAVVRSDVFLTGLEQDCPDWRPVRVRGYRLYRFVSMLSPIALLYPFLLSSLYASVLSPLFVAILSGVWTVAVISLLMLLRAIWRWAIRLQVQNPHRRNHGKVPEHLT